MIEATIAFVFLLIGYAFGYMQSRADAPVQTVEQARAILLKAVKERAKQPDAKVGPIKRPTAADYRRNADPVKKGEEEAMNETFEDMGATP